MHVYILEYIQTLGLFIQQKLHEQFHLGVLGQLLL